MTWRPDGARLMERLGPDTMAVMPAISSARGTPHGICHWIGMDVHDVGDYQRPLAAGMTFVVEPGIYIRPQALAELADTPGNRKFKETVAPAVEKYQHIGIRIEDSLAAAGLRYGPNWVFWPLRGKMLSMNSSITDLPRIPASDVKKRGWRGVMRALTSKGPVVVTNHSEPEAVILSAQDYARMLTIVKETESQTEAGLEALRHRFDERLAALREPDAGDRLRAISRSPAKLRGKVKAGTGY